MLKRNYAKRIAAGVLAVIVAMTTVLAGVGGTLSVEAASTYKNENLLVNPDFEESTEFSPAGSSHLGNWYVWQNAAKTTDAKQSGNASVKFTGNESALEQDVASTDLIQGMTYVYTVWARLTGETSEEHIVGVKNYGGSEIKQQVTSTEWTEYKIEFEYTSGNPRVYGYVGTHAGVDMYIDNASVTAKSGVESVSIENGQLTVKFAESYTPSETDLAALTANYSVAPGDDAVNGLNLTLESWNEGTKTAVLSFPKIAAIPVDQTVTVNLSYMGAMITLDYTVEADGSEVVTANLDSVSAENGQITAILDTDPTVAPVVGDFTWEYKIGDSEYKALSVEGFSYASATKTATASFDAMRSATVQTVTVKVTYGEVSEEDTFTLEASNANTYYVDSTNGNDSNDGLTPEAAFASIDKLNTITFRPGDQILFKKGETFVGCFKPQGSGTETAPITIGSYGDGDERPVLQPGEDWTVSHVMSANAIVYNPKVNYVIQFYNVEYWEVSDLEIFDPNSEEYLTKGSDKYIGNSANDVYRSGITIQAEDIGTLEHFYVDNVVIHGFHGPGTNIGKTSGGITMNVITNASRNRAQSVPTQINDIRITNCEIYDVGRSGINFLTPWSFRTEEKWGPFDYGTRGYDYLPYEDFYMANNYIHDVDGDGTIIDNCSNAVAEYNLVTRCCLRPQTEGGGAAVGLFNWNSDDVRFQFNEVYDIRVGSGATASNDGQGIEIDALNDRTWVQYNYVHDNMGGFMMLCNVDDNYRSFDGIVRYNISQDDYTHPRQGLFDIYSANYGTEIYNNTFYFTDRAVSANGYGNYADAGELFLFSAVGAYETMKFYNNIFYYDGETPVAANQFGDGAIDWQSNIFYGFTNLPENDNENAPNMSMDPMLVNAGKGGTGEAADVIGVEHDKEIGWVDLSCYYLQEGSPAIDAGVPVEDNGGRDYFGNKVTGIPDIGAYESGSVTLKLLSMNADIVIDQVEKTVTITDTAKITAKTLMESLVYEDGVTVELKRDTTELEGGIRLSEGDVVTGIYDGQTVSYTVKVVEGEAQHEELPLSALMNATAGNEEIEHGNASEGSVLLAIDGNESTKWHTEWYPEDNNTYEDHWLKLELDGVYKVNGFKYLPRQDNSTNGDITGYQIQISMDDTNWTTVDEGTWVVNKEWKIATFAAQDAKYVRLQVVDAETDQETKHFSSAAEVRVLGPLTDETVPTAPSVSASEITDTSVKISWTESADANGIADYVLVMNGKEIAAFDPDVTSYAVNGLKSDTEYTFSVYAVDGVGNRSEAGTVSVTTKKQEGSNSDNADNAGAAEGSNTSTGSSSDKTTSASSGSVSMGTQTASGASTGDMTNITLYVVICVAATAVLFVGKRKTNV